MTHNLATTPTTTPVVLDSRQWQAIAWSLRPGVWDYEDGFDPSDIERWRASGTLLTALQRRGGTADQKGTYFVLLGRLLKPKRPTHAVMSEAA